MAEANVPTVRGVVTLSMRKSAGKRVGEEADNGIPNGNDCVYGVVVESEIAARATWAEKIPRHEMAASSKVLLVKRKLGVLLGLFFLPDRRERIGILPALLNNFYTTSRGIPAGPCGR
jgi:hypothetical protein